MTSVLLAGRSAATHMSWILLGAVFLATAAVSVGVLAANRLGWLPKRFPELDGLPRQQRRLVVRAVELGEPVLDPALAPAALSYARRVVDRLGEHLGRGWFAAMWALAVLFFAMAAWSCVDADYAAAILQLTSGSAFAASPYLRRRQYWRARAAADANAHLLAASGSATLA